MRARQLDFAALDLSRPPLAVPRHWEAGAAHRVANRKRLSPIKAERGVAARCPRCIFHALRRALDAHELCRVVYPVQRRRLYFYT